MRRQRDVGIKIRVWGETACFTRPEMKVERVTYDVITPSAARGILESIYWHPGMYYQIDRIYVLKPIRFTNLRRNEVGVKILAGDVLSMAKGGSVPKIVTSDVIQQRASMMLYDVDYVIEAHICISKNAEDGDLLKHKNILKRRLERGACYSQPYLGTRECTAYFSAWNEERVPSIPETKDLGWMLYDMDYSNQSNILPKFFRAQMDHGVIDLTKCGTVI